MRSEQIKEKVLQYKWEPWADRPFGAFVASIFKAGNSRAFMRQIGLDAELPAMLGQKGNYHKSTEVWDLFAEELRVNLDRGETVFSIVKRCEGFGDSSRGEIDSLILSSLPPIEKLTKLHKILAILFSYTWVTHGLEHIYVPLLYQEVPKYMDGDIETNIGDISFPVKKNAHVFFEDALRSDILVEEVQNRFAWIKVRDGFSDGFSLKELSEERKRLQAAPPKVVFTHPAVPKELEKISRIAQELVYYRTMRTDLLWESMYRSRVILQEVARFYGLTFKDLRDYAIYDLIGGTLEKYEYGNFTAVSLGSEFAFFHGPILEDELHVYGQELKGAIAFKGKARGRAKIVMTAYDIGKVEEGDILFAPTTAPSYIIGMQKAAAFVTDEGGITSHASIVAREMKKPCVIGTKFATKIFKDGDLVEVDAESGIVRILKL